MDAESGDFCQGLTHWHTSGEAKVACELGAELHNYGR